MRSLSAILLALGGACLAQDAPPPTYAADIAPILHRHCVECHRPGVGAPFDLLSFDDASRRARTILKVVESGRMPPWKPERGHTPLLGERGLSEAEKSDIAAWVRAGAPEGDPALAPALPEFPEAGWRLGTPDIVVSMDRAYAVPAEGPDEYRNFVIPLPDVPEGTWIRAVEYRASAPAVVHHCLIDLDYQGRGRVLDARDEAPGFEALDQIFEDTRIAAYAVGSIPYWLPEGCGYELKPGADLILETHFHPSGKVEHEQTTVALYLTHEPPTRELVTLSLPPTFGMTTSLDIPAGAERHVHRHRYTLDYDVLAVHIFPHAHMVCREMYSVAKFPDGEELTLIAIMDWDFAWQEIYRFADMPMLPAGTVIDMTWVYDNSENNVANPHAPPRRVVWGHQTTDEMASLTLTVTPVRNEEAEPLRNAHHEYQKEQYRNVPLEVLQPIIVQEIYSRFDVNRNGLLGPFEIADMGNYWRDANQRNRGNRAWDLERIAVHRAADPYLREYVGRAVKYASLTGVSLLLLVIAGVLAWFRRRRRRGA